MKKILIIQTAFIGDVILATALVEKLHHSDPSIQIDFLLRKGNEKLLEGHPIIKNVLIWDKQGAKYSNLLRIATVVKRSNYDVVVNLQRFASSGLITAYSGAKLKLGFSKNPFSILFSKKFEHSIGNGMHEVERNQQLIADLTDNIAEKPKLYPSQKDKDSVGNFKGPDYICMAPTSVWKTKELPQEQWVKLIDKLGEKSKVYLLGGPGDTKKCEEIKQLSDNGNVINLSGKLSFLSSAELMKGARMNYVNDSGPLHIASAMNAPVTAFFCSTVPSFGFGPLSDDKTIVEVSQDLPCRPCGLHGKTACPKGHFDCGFKIQI